MMNRTHDIQLDARRTEIPSFGEGEKASEILQAGKAKSYERGENSWHTGLVYG